MKKITIIVLLLLLTACGNGIKEYSLEDSSSIRVDEFGEFTVSEIRYNEYLTDVVFDYSSNYHVSECYSISINSEIIDGVNVEDIDISFWTLDDEKIPDGLVFVDTQRELSSIHNLNPKLGADNIFNNETLNGNLFLKKLPDQDIILKIEYENIVVNLMLPFAQVTNLELIPFTQVVPSLVDGIAHIPGFGDIELLDIDFNEYTRNEKEYNELQALFGEYGGDNYVYEPSHRLSLQLKVTPLNEPISFDSGSNFFQYYTRDNFNFEATVTHPNELYLTNTMITEETTGYIEFQYDFTEPNVTLDFNYLASFLYIKKTGYEESSYMVLVIDGPTTYE